MEANKPRDIYGYRARIGYLSPPAATEVFPYEFYMVAPKGVSLVVSTLAISAMNKEEIDRSYEMSLRAARELARAQVDVVVFGGRPINRARGGNIQDVISEVERDIKVPVLTSTSAQMGALAAVGAKHVVLAHPFPEEKNDTESAGMAEYNLELAGIRGAGYPAHLLGLVPRSAAMSMARELMKHAPHADTLWMPCPHWAVAESIDPIEKEFGINVITSHQAIMWSAMRRCKVNDRIEGFGRLLRDF